MKRYLGAVIVAAMVPAIFAVSAFALPPDPGAKFALHAKTHAAKAATICTTESPNGSSTPCSAYVVDYPISTGLDVYLMLANGDSLGFSGATFGIAYNNTEGAGVDVTSWTACVDGLVIPSDPPHAWPESESGIVLTYLTCQRTFIGGEGVHAVLGSFYLYAYGPDKFGVTEHRQLQPGNNQKLVTANCNGASVAYPESEWNARTGYIGFGTQLGCNPCLVQCDGVPAESTTWGKIKNKYLSPGS